MRGASQSYGRARFFNEIGHTSRDLIAEGADRFSSQLPSNVRAMIGKLFALLSVVPLALSFPVKPIDIPDDVVLVYPVSGSVAAGEFYCPFHVRLGRRLHVDINLSINPQAPMFRSDWRLKLDRRQITAPSAMFR